MHTLVAFIAGNIRSVSSNDADRYQAVQALLRPAEVLPLFRPATMAELWVPMPERIGAWIRQMFTVNRLRYQADPPGMDWWQAPSYTWSRGAGDCEDFSLLVLSMLQLQHVSAVLVTGTYQGSAHAWVEGRDACGAFLVEATNGNVFRHIRPSVYIAGSAFGGNFYQRLAA